MAPFARPSANRPGGQKTLEELEQANLLVIPLDEQRRWFLEHVHLDEAFAWMLSPEALAAASGEFAFLPPSKTAAPGESFARNPAHEIFLDLLSNANTGYVASTLFSAKLNEALSNAEGEILQALNLFWAGEV